MNINENVNLAFTLLVSTNVRLIKEINYNKIIKRFAQVGGGTGKKITEKMAENVSKIPSNKVKLGNQNIKNKNPHWKKPSLKKNNNYKDNNKFTDIKQKNNKEFTFPKKNTVQQKNTFEDLVKKHPIDHENGNLKKSFTNFQNSIPTPPKLPTKLLVKPLEKIKIENINPETLEAAKKNLKNQHHLPSMTKINENTNIDNFSRNDIIEEMYSRGLINIEDDNKKEPIIVLKDEEGNEVSSIGQMTNIKINSLGLAYIKEYEKCSLISKNIAKYDNEDVEFFLTLPLSKPTEETCLLSSKQTHIVAIVTHKKDNNEEFFLIGYLTSNKKGKLLSEIQFNKFQEIQENNNLKKENKEEKFKEQYFKPLQYKEKIKKEDFIKLKYSNEYLNQGTILEILKKYHQHQQDNEIYYDYNPIGYRREDLLKICKIFDNIIKNKQKQPQTNEQKEYQEESIKKQKKIQEEKKVFKENNKKYKDSHKEEENNEF